MYLIITILWTFFQSHFLQNSRLLSVHIASLRIYRLSIYPIYFVDISHCIKAFTQKRLTLMPYWGLDSLPQPASRTDWHRLASNGREVQSYLCKLPDSLPKKRTHTGHGRSLPFNWSSPSGKVLWKPAYFSFSRSRISMSSFSSLDGAGGIGGAFSALRWNRLIPFTMQNTTKVIIRKFRTAWIKFPYVIVAAPILTLRSEKEFSFTNIPKHQHTYTATVHSATKCGRIISARKLTSVS